MVNEYLSKQAFDKTGQSRKYKPFEIDSMVKFEDDPIKQLSNLNAFYFKPCTLSDESTKELYNEMKPEYKRQLENNAKTKKEQFEQKLGQAEEQKQMEIEAKAKQKYLESSLSHRLQTENPFDEFKKAVEKAVIEKAVKKNKFFDGDQDFFKESDDIGMCLSMH